MLDKNFREQIKLESEEKILHQGWDLCAWLEPIGEPNIRDVSEIKNRLSVMNAIAHLKFNIPFKTVALWLKKYNLLSFLSQREIYILKRIQKSGITPLENSYLLEHIESIWALMWILVMINDLSPQIPSKDINQYLPNLEKNEDNKIIDDIYYMRPIGDLYATVDYYYRLHWYCVQQMKLGIKGNYPSENRIYHRRKVLSWVYNKDEDWDSPLPPF